MPTHAPWLSVSTVAQQLKEVMFMLLGAVVSVLIDRTYICPLITPYTGGESDSGDGLMGKLIPLLDCHPCYFINPFCQTDRQVINRVRPSKTVSSSHLSRGQS
jgi:hypothetical protein